MSIEAAPESHQSTSNLRVSEFTPLPTPQEIAADLPLDARLADVVARGRDEVRAVMDGVDDRLLVIVGPCSIHDPEAGLEYARRLVSQAERHREDLLIVMRTYFEKPRTTVGWKGLINDPRLDGSHDIAAGLRAARSFLRQVTGLGLPAATEFLEPISPQYMADLVAWGAIGARTTESQIHRQLASGLSMPIGFKNGTDGDLQVALDACSAAAAAQAFLGIDGAGRAALVATAGNPDTHIILRGGRGGPNYSVVDIEVATAKLAATRLNPRLIVDASHANSGKDHRRQAEVALEIGARLAGGGSMGGAIAGVMLESFLVGGAQSLDVAEHAAGTDKLVYGQSVTDACMDWDVTESVLASLADSARVRRTRA
ncbi:3-deoxy-7-phosphoheptulonate synthase [Arthrobacter sp. AL08]|uniref:3-deoxy-7-phosphoheptulonate synthase n=1 Tax=Micrococcaceae TaxID=1268 RepID=UPI001CFF9689|nr:MULTISPECIES: 3-deoxy-7-phosphoheptulonate synthase [Micrococcaceae]MCB5281516.1 Phospho-2-dehydro-3-deoxyheptonate aldolase, Phe-sensitive [Arthrobacter sp. ES1]MDI3240095.1 3-deoxy-7-phosphoheptulonate synthase [Arthrobacter sp. AL05]MDI3276105.1 3-deoxy-7-phosphoheptulonate synthase [Arthrobacter sp. AL08]MDJ0353889.1 3-deoxy-7-phosphoheptulonate synthase [Pseudarthrobacter sp. PH31-O2]WGZ78902.1 3-deoxy-7-phosphoheptulonate synthase [Arthrobacter sp. EM1]